jgi:hypothetical protein
LEDADDVTDPIRISISPIRISIGFKLIDILPIVMGCIGGIAGIVMGCIGCIAGISVRCIAKGWAVSMALAVTQLMLLP